MKSGSGIIDLCECLGYRLFLLWNNKYRLRLRKIKKEMKFVKLKNKVPVLKMYTSW